MTKRLRVLKQSKTGRNELFQDVHSKKILTRKQVIDCIKHGDYPDYHLRIINGKETPCSNPDNDKFNNLD